jgi:hypothetical protein
MIHAIHAASAAGLLTLASFTCDPQQAPPVQIIAQKHNPVYRNDTASRQLGQFHVDTTFAKNPNEVFVTGGLTVGKVETKYDLNFQIKTDPVSNTSCLWVDQADVRVDYAPDVYIASEYRPDTCHYRITMEHELRHVNTDILTLNEYLPRLQAAATSALARAFSLGPIPAGQVKNEQQRIVGIVNQAITGALEEADSVRQKRQQMIDTRQEYLRLSGACPQEPDTIKPY